MKGGVNPHREAGVARSANEKNRLRQTSQFHKLQDVGIGGNVFFDDDEVGEG